MDTEAIKKQSQQCYRQFCGQWRENAKIHATYKQNSFAHLQVSGVGRAILCVANGFSFEENIETIKKYAHNVDIICCDKTLGHLLDHGISPKYCLVADANVNFEKYLEPWKDKLRDTTLLMNVCGNPKWTHERWKDRYFFVFKDVMNYEREFMALSGCPNVITAGTNVSNMMVVAITQCDNEVTQNFMGYDKIILIGYDYNWKPNGKYYAFDETGNGKANYMRHITGLSHNGNMFYSSNNLAGSADWLEAYIKTFKLPIVQCSPESMLMARKKTPDLAAQMKYRFNTSDREEIHKAMLKKNHIEQQFKKINDKLRNIGKEHYFAHLATL